MQLVGPDVARLQRPDALLRERLAGDHPRATAAVASALAQLRDSAEGDREPHRHPSDSPDEQSEPVVPVGGTDHLPRGKGSESRTADEPPTLVVEELPTDGEPP